MPSRLDLLLDFAAKKPDDPFPHYGVAIEYKNLGRLDDAARAFDALLARHPDYVAAYLHAGNVQLALGRKDDARKTYQAGIAAARRKSDLHAASELEAALQALE